MPPESMLSACLCISAQIIGKNVEAIEGYARFSDEAGGSPFAFQPNASPVPGKGTGLFVSHF
jgi:hypothetical protein